MSSFGSEFRQAQRSSQRFEFAAYAACGGAGLCVAAFIGLGVAIYNVNYGDGAQQRQMEMAQAAKAQSPRRSGGGLLAAGNSCEAQMRRTALAVNVAMAMSPQGRTMIGENRQVMTLDQADEICRTFEQIGELHRELAR